MATIDASNAALLKTRADEKFAENVFAGAPYLAMIEKLPGVGGKTYQVALQLGATIARGKRFQDVISNAAPTKRVEVDYAFQENYVAGYCPGLDAALASGGPNSIADLVGVEQDVAYSTAGQLLEQTAVRGDGYGTIAVVDSVVSGTTGTVVFQLKNKPDCLGIFVDDVLAAKSNPATASLVTAGNMKVTGVDPMLGQITVTMLAGQDGSGYAGYGLGLAATYANSTSIQTIQSLNTMFTRTGLSGPFESLSSRSADPVRLAGHVYSVGSLGVKDSISLLISSISNYPGAKPDCALVSTSAYLDLEQELGDAVRYTDAKGNGPGKMAEVLFPSITFRGPFGDVDVIAVPFLHDEDIYVIDTSSLFLTTAEAEMIAKMDPEAENGSGWVQLQTADAKRLGLRMFGAHGCRAFWKNGRAIRTIA